MKSLSTTSELVINPSDELGVNKSKFRISASFEIEERELASERRLEPPVNSLEKSGVANSGRKNDSSAESKGRELTIRVTRAAGTKNKWKCIEDFVS